MPNLRTVDPAPPADETIAPRGSVLGGSVLGGDGLGGDGLRLAER